MKTAIGYLFLSLAASLVGVVVVLLFFAMSGKLYTLDDQLYNKWNIIGMSIYGIIHLSAIFPLSYYGLKWSKREYRNTVPATDHTAVTYDPS